MSKSRRLFGGHAVSAPSITVPPEGVQEREGREHQCEHNDMRYAGWRTLLYIRASAPRYGAEIAPSC